MRDDVGEQLGRQGDGTTGFHHRRETGLDAEAQIKARQAEPAGCSVSGDQDIGQHRVGGTTGNSPADQLKTAVQFRLAADQFHPNAASGATKLPHDWLNRNAFPRLF